MKKIEDQLNDAREAYYNDDLSLAQQMEFRHGPRYEDPSFKPESETEFYNMIVSDLLRKIDKKILITKKGAFCEGDEFEFVNRELDKGGEYIAKGNLIIKDDEWVLSWNGSIYQLDEVAWI